MNRAAAVLILVAGSTFAAAQEFAIEWHSIEGATARVGGGVFALDGTAGQADAGPTLSGGAFTLTGGFWVVASGAACSIADVSAVFGTLDVNDLVTFVNAFNAMNLAVADIAPFGGDGVLNVNDIVEFVNAFNAGCP